MKIKNNQKTAVKTISEDTKKTREKIEQLLQNSPIPPQEMIRNLGLYILPTDLQKILFMNDLYQKFIDIHGVIMEFGVRWGNNLSILQSLRSIYEPYNHNRKIYGFDTFEGFSSVHSKDGNNEIIKNGNLATTKNYIDYLDQLLRLKENESPVKELKKFGLIKGDINFTLKKFLDNNPQTIIAFAYFDFDLYQPTKFSLETIANYITKGTVIGFDELNNSTYPGETIALKEVLGLSKYKIRRSPYSHTQSYIIVE